MIAYTDYVCWTAAVVAVCVGFTWPSLLDSGAGWGCTPCCTLSHQCAPVKPAIAMVTSNMQHGAPITVSLPTHVTLNRLQHRHTPVKSAIGVNVITICHNRHCYTAASPDRLGHKYLYIFYCFNGNIYSESLMSPRQGVGPTKLIVVFEYNFKAKTLKMLIYVLL